jgi:predicted anti-sigma-YlaC factor YlaD
MKRMECSEVERWLWEYLDEELTPEEAGAIGAHLGDCRCCRPTYQCNRAFLERLAHCRLARVSAPASLVARLGRLL